MSRTKNVKYSISENLKSLRNNLNISAPRLSHIIDININSWREYEKTNKIPSLGRLIKISNFFGVSLDFILRGNECNFPRSLKLLEFAKKIDKLDEFKRFQIVSTANTLIDDIPLPENIRMDTLEIHLTDSFHTNLKLARKDKSLPQIQLSEKVGVLRNRISAYEISQFPPPPILCKISDFLNISIHALGTGQKLQYEFVNGDLLNVILKADHLLPLKEITVLINLMSKITQKK